MASILVVDDEPDLRVMVRLFLEPSGHEVLEAADGADALEVVQDAIPDLILLDLTMPLMDGWRFLDELRRRGLREKTRVIIVSASAEPDAIARGRAAGAHAHIGKPFEQEDLLAAVDAALEESPEQLVRQQDRSMQLAAVLSLLEEPGDTTR